MFRSFVTAIISWGLLAIKVVPVVLIVLDWGAPWWVALPVGLILCDLVGGFLTWWLLESVAGVSNWLLLGIASGVGICVWYMPYSLLLAARG